MTMASTAPVIKTRHADLLELGNHGGQREEVFNFYNTDAYKSGESREEEEEEEDRIHIFDKSGVSHSLQSGGDKKRTWWRRAVGSEWLRNKSQGGTRRGHSGGALLAVSG